MLKFTIKRVSADKWVYLVAKGPEKGQQAATIEEEPTGWAYVTLTPCDGRLPRHMGKLSPAKMEPLHAMAIGETKEA